MGVDHRAPGRAPAAADRGQLLGALVDLDGKPALAALERQPRRLDLERDAEVGDVVQLLGPERGDARAAVRLDLHEPLGGERPESGPERVARHAVVVAQLLLPQAGAGLELALEDAGAQGRHERVNR